MWPPGEGRALFWDGIGPSIDLTPPGAEGAQAWGIDNGMQVGGVEYPAGVAAAAWFGTAESYIDINPPGATYSSATKVRNGVIAGAATIGGVFGAGIWTSPSSNSFVSLNPPGVQGSTALGTNGTYQVGYTIQNSDTYAAVWQGTMASYQNIHPAGRHESRAICVDDGLIGGYSTFNTARDATLWAIPSYTSTNLHPYNTEPFGYSTSEVWAIADGIQVGYFAQFGDPQASMWEGTGGSWFSLERFLPPGANYSRARGISTKGNDVYILVESEMPGSGPQAFVLKGKRTSEVLPTSVVVGPGLLDSGGVPEVLLSDDNVLRARPGPVFSTLMAPLQLVVEATCPVADPGSIELVLESRASVPGITIEIAYYNWLTQSYEVAGSGATFAGDRTMNGYKGAMVSRFVEPTSRVMRARISYKPNAPIFAFPWLVAVDRTVFKIPRIK